DRRQVEPAQHRPGPRPREAAQARGASRNAPGIGAPRPDVDIPEGVEILDRARLVGRQRRIAEDCRQRWLRAGRRERRHAQGRGEAAPAEGSTHATTDGNLPTASSAAPPATTRSAAAAVATAQRWLGPRPSTSLAARRTTASLTRVWLDA